MPALQNPKHERFAQELAKGKTASEAYVIAGYKANDGNAATLKGNQRVLERVARLQHIASQRVEVTVASLIQEAGEIQAAAMQEKQLSAATAALTVKAKLAGLWVDKSENTNRNTEVSVNRMTDEQLESIASGRGDGASEATASAHQLN